MTCGRNSIADCRIGYDGSPPGPRGNDGGNYDWGDITGPWPCDNTGAKHSTCTLGVDATTKALNIYLSATQADDVYFYVRVDDFGAIPSDGYQSYAQQ